MGLSRSASRPVAPSRMGNWMPRISTLFSNRSIGAKLAVMTIVGAICMALVAATILLVARSQLITERTEKAHAIVDAVWQMADGFQNAAASGKMTEEEAKKRFFEAAGSVWYENHTNYVFIYDYETGFCVSNPGVPTLLGKDMRGVKDAFGLPFASMLMDLARQGQGSLRYSFLRSSTDPTPLDKVAFTRGFAPWHLMIGNAQYISDVDASFWSMVRTASVVIALLMLLSIAVAWAITRSVVKPLSGLKERMASLSAGELEAPVANAERRDEIGSRKFRRPLRPPWKSRAPPPRKFPGTCSAPRKEPRRSKRVFPTSSAAHPKREVLPPRCCRPRNRCRPRAIG
jgi:methyl-accepting chemotaxis protein